jgi:hypothetical protein
MIDEIRKRLQRVPFVPFGVRAASLKGKACARLRV